MPGRPPPSTRDSLDAAKEGSAKALEQTRISNEATQESNRIAREAMEWAHRAWLVPVGFLENKSLSLIDLKCKNTGGMPATEITVSTHFLLIRQDKIIKTIPAEEGRINPIGNGETFTIIVRPATPLSPEETRSIEGAQDKLTATIEIKYSDAFDDRVTTLFCVWNGGKWASWRGILS
ncbi:MAG TPA: hypothetical protein VGS22_21760 [Thermoanaerobaculia bacterium]|jgi:hypothetical protein|nr:hypothetical protein [Thermoanaerobaculia bacterium]